MEKLEKHEEVNIAIQSVIKELIESYHSGGGANGINGRMIPSRQSIVKIHQTLQSLLFPGFYEETHIDAGTIHPITGQRLFYIYQHLAEEIEKGLCHICEKTEECDDHEECILRAREITLKLLKFLPQVRNQLSLDVEALFQGDPAAKSRSEIILAYPGLRAISAYRVANFLYKHDVPLIPRMMMEYVHHETGIDIHPGATIGDSFFIDHGTGIVIGETTIIGKNVKIYHGVTLGAFAVDKALKDKKRHPTIEDDCTIYAGATILGGETVIGKGSVVGANVWLTKSVEPGSTVR